MKRLGSPNFTQLPINAPRRPVMNFNQDGHMAMTNPKGRVNYEPNSWGAEAGPRENPTAGHVSFPAPVEGVKARTRSDTFADHYSQARMFYRSQQPIEQRHIADAFIFELSKVERVDIRARAVSHLVNVDDGLAATVADELAMAVPAAAKAAMPTLDVATSDKLSILANGPDNFKGRKLGILLTDGSSATTFAALTAAVDAAGAVWQLIAPKIGGVTLDDGQAVAARHKLKGAPSVLFDAVAVLPSAAAAALLAQEPVAKQFVADAFAHCKFIGHNAEAVALFTAAGLPSDRDAGFVALADSVSANDFVDACAALRLWDREPKLLPAN